MVSPIFLLGFKLWLSEQILPGEAVLLDGRLFATCAGFLADSYDLFTIDLVVLILQIQYGEELISTGRAILPWDASQLGPANKLSWLPCLSGHNFSKHLDFVSMRMHDILRIWRPIFTGKSKPHEVHQRFPS